MKNFYKIGIAFVISAWTIFIGDVGIYLNIENKYITANYLFQTLILILT